MSSTPDIAALQADIAARRANLARTVDELSQRATPQAIAKQQSEVYRARFTAATRTPEGELRRERLAAVVAAVVALVGLSIVLRRRRG